MEVEFQPQQSKGELEGCSVVFRAAFRDHVYKSGKMAMVSGNFTFYVKDPNSAFVTIKAGIIDLEPLSKIANAPEFSYLQSGSASTAKARYIANDSDTPGFRLWVLAIDEEVAEVMGNILSRNPLTLGMLRKGGKLDVLVPIDLTVAGTDVSAVGKVSRRHSDQAIQRFTECFVKLSDRLKK
jgi:hypothetical protein